MMSETLVTIAACIIVADFITGVAHWFEDTYLTPSIPVLGKHVADPNIDHHLRPADIGTMSGFINRNYQTVVPALFVMVLLLALVGMSTWPIGLTLILAGFGNEVHAWNHRRSNGRFIRFLQDTALIQTPQHHARHHKQPFDGRYCTLTNITNPVLDGLRFWRFVEWAILKTTGITVKRCSPERLGV